MSQSEQPEYILVKSTANIEIRDYPPMIIAQVEALGERKEAIKEGFKILADYIFGNNTTNKSIDNTVAENHEISEKIPMTIPVIQEHHLNNWKVRFFMPKKYTIETLPKPNSKEISLIHLPAKRFAVIQFSGLADDDSLRKHQKQLETYLLGEQLTPQSESLFAFYNPPWTLPFLRRNEVMIEIGVDQ